MALTTARENSLLIRSSAFDSCVKNADGSTKPLGSADVELVASYSSRIEMDGLLHRIVSFATSRSWILAVTVIVYRDACCSVEKLVGAIMTFVTAPTSTASAPAASGTIL